MSQDEGIEIEKAIYEKAKENPGFAIAYALLLLSAALNNIKDDHFWVKLVKDED
jgi:hypothetical protein